MAAPNRANVMQLKLMAQSHPTGLTPNLLKLFQPRPPVEFKPPPEKPKLPPYTGFAQFVQNFAEPGDPEYAPPPPKIETRDQKRARIRSLRLEKGAQKAAEELQKYDPKTDPNATGDAYKTLFVSNLSYETTEQKLKREFESFGPVKGVRVVYDKVSNKPRGYAFVEFVNSRDMKSAYKKADGMKIDNRRVAVDVERGRTVLNWRPRRLGGGLGCKRLAVEQEPPAITTAGLPLSAEMNTPGAERERSRDPALERDRERSHGRHRKRSRSRSPSRSRERSRGRRGDRERELDANPDRDVDRDRHYREYDGDRDRDRDRHHRERGHGRGRRERYRDRARRSASRDYEDDS